MTSDTSERLPGLHALRVVAAVSVFAGHSIFWAKDWVGLPSTALAGYLVLGLQLFFVVSAFSLMHSTQVYKSAPNWRARFYLKRFWRIAPLFYVMMLVDGLFSQHFFGIYTSATEIVLDLLFINNFWPQYTSSIVYAGWSVSVEMLFYAMFPIIIARVRTVRSGVALAAGGIVVSQATRMLAFDHIRLPFGTYADNAFLVLFQYFCEGVLAYLAFERLKRTRVGAPRTAREALAYHAIFGALATTLALVIVIFHRQLSEFGRLDLTLCGGLFALVTTWFALLRIPALNWQPIQYFGERSYSLYLLHIVFIFALRPVTIWVYHNFYGALGIWAMVPVMIATYIPIMAASVVTYALIEKPGMDFGRALRSRLRSKQPSPPALEQS